MNGKWFSKFSSYLSTLTGRPVSFVLAVLLVMLWAVTGPLFGYSDTWQLVINTSTTIVTFLMVFLIQNTQNRDTAAMHIKLDELIRAMEGAHNALLDLEELDEKDLTRFRKRYEALANEARIALRQGNPDTNSPFIDEDHGDDDNDGGSHGGKHDASADKSRQFRTSKSESDNR